MMELALSGGGSITTDADVTLYGSLKEWQARGEQLFPESPETMRFRCPNCGHIGSVAEKVAAGLDRQEAPTSCIGRAALPGKPTVGCNWSASGLLTVGETEFILTDQGAIRVFPFAPPTSTVQGGAPDG